MNLITVTCLDYGNYYVNPANVSFISTGEKRDSDNGQIETQLFFHFNGGRESCMVWVSSPDQVLKSLNAD